MKAKVGDILVTSSRTVGRPAREGEVVELRNPDGSPPYLVAWSDTGHRALVFPGPDTHLKGEAHPKVPTEVARHVRSWHIDVDLFEASDGTTAAHAVLAAESAERLEGRGEAHRRPGDADVPEIGDEVAVARALSALSDRILAAASADIAALEGRQVLLTH